MVSDAYVFQFWLQNWLQRSNRTTVHCTSVNIPTMQYHVLSIGAVYDIRENYDDVFFVIGSIFIMSSLLFASIPLIQKHRERSEAAAVTAGGSHRGETVGIIRPEHKQTSKIPQRSVSKASLGNESGGGGGGGGGGVAEYGSTASNDKPYLCTNDVSQNTTLTNSAATAAAVKHGGSGSDFADFSSLR